MYSKISKNLNKKGFSLIELIVVIAIIGVLVMLAAPKFMGYTERAKVKRIQNDVKVVEGKIMEEYISSDYQFDGNMSHTELDGLIGEKTLYGTEGKVEKGSVEEGNYKEVGVNLIKEARTKLTGTFYANADGKVYYVDEKVSGNNNNSNNNSKSTEIVFRPAPSGEVNKFDDIEIIDDNIFFKSGYEHWSKSASYLEWDPIGDNIYRCLYEPNPTYTDSESNLKRNKDIEQIKNEKKSTFANGIKWSIENHEDDWIVLTNNGDITTVINTATSKLENIEDKRSIKVLSEEEIVSLLKERMRMNLELISEEDVPDSIMSKLPKGIKEYYYVADKNMYIINIITDDGIWCLRAHLSDGTFLGSRGEFKIDTGINKEYTTEESTNIYSKEYCQGACYKKTFQMTANKQIIIYNEYNNDENNITNQLKGNPIKVSEGYVITDSGNAYSVVDLLEEKVNVSFTGVSDILLSSASIKNTESIIIKRRNGSITSDTNKVLDINKDHIDLTEDDIKKGFYIDGDEVLIISLYNGLLKTTPIISYNATLLDIFPEVKANEISKIRLYSVWDDSQEETKIVYLLKKDGTALRSSIKTYFPNV